MRIPLYAISLFAISMLPGIASAQTTIYASDLTNKVAGGTTTGTVSGSGDSSFITLGSARNQQVTWDMPTVSLTQVDDYITISMDLSLNSVLSPQTSNPSFDIRLQNKASGYYAALSLRTAGGASAAIFPTSIDSNNGGRFDTGVMSVSAASPSVFSFTLTKSEQPATSGLMMNASGAYITAGSVTKEATSTPTSTIFDQVVFRFAAGDTVGDWNTPKTLTLDNFSITSNTGVPEPSTFALIAAALALLGTWCYRRR